MRFDTDILIVGGGPAGLSAALFCQHRFGKSVSLQVVEKARYPREKYCAGGLGGRAEMALARIGVVVDVPGVSTTGISLLLPKGKISGERGHVGRVVRRIEFDHELANQVKARGIPLEEGCSLRELTLTPDGVIAHTHRGEIRAKMVIGADGVGSQVRKAMGLGKGHWRAQVLEVDTPVSPLDGPRSILHFDAFDSSLSGYEWDFPTLVDGKAMVCRGIYHLILPGEKATEVDLNEKLGVRLRKFGFDLADCRKKRFAERGFAPHEPASAPRVLLLGEAAGIDPITGEGIAQAILYGEVAARYLEKHLPANRFDFQDWSGFLQTTKLGIDMRTRHFMCQRFFGPARGFYENALYEVPGFLELGVQYFGGFPLERGLTAKVTWQVLRRLWRDRAQQPFQVRPLSAATSPAQLSA